MLSSESDDPAGAAFWSYTRADDDNDAGQIKRLSERVATEFRALTGSSIEIFIDQADLRWGDDWASEIERAVLATNFLIPIVTPSYFKSQACRDELLTFSAQTRKAGSELLVMPIYWIEVSELTNDGKDAGDEAVALVARQQWLDMRHARLEEETSSIYRKAVHAAAVELAARVDRLEQPAPASGSQDKPERREPRSAPAAGVEGPEDPPDEEPGFIEKLANLEELTPRLNDIVEEMAAEFERIGGIVTAASDFNDSDSMKLRMTRATQVAANIQPHASRVQELGQEYAATVVEIDPGVLALLELSVSPDSTDPHHEDEDSEPFAKIIVDMAAAAREALEDACGMESALSDLPKVSRAFASPAKSFRRGIQGLRDGQRRIDAWSELAETLLDNEND